MTDEHLVLPPPKPNGTGWFEKKITLGNLIQIIVFVVGLSVAYANLQAHLASLDTKVDTMWISFTQQIYNAQRSFSGK